MLTINEPMAATAAHLAARADCSATRWARRSSRRCAARRWRWEVSCSVTSSKSFQSGHESYSLYSCSVINGGRRPLRSNKGAAKGKINHQPQEVAR